MHNSAKPAILCVANWKSDVGYAWWLMESYWVKISELYADKYTTLLAYPEINAVPEAIENSDIHYFQHSFRASSVGDIRRNMALIKKHNIKVLYLSDYGVSAPDYALYRTAGVEKIIVHDHTPGLRTKASGIKKLLKKVKANLPLMRADAAFGATGFVTRRLTDTACFDASRCYTVQNGILPFNPTATPENRWQQLVGNTGARVIVTAARANRYKGIDFALQVVAELVHTHKQTDIIYLLCGDGPDLEAFREQAASLGIESYCRFPGRVDNASQLLGYCYLGFQPAQGEVGYSLSILEYMYAGLPVVVPDNKSVCEATANNKTGTIYPQGNVKLAADAIAGYLDNPASQQRQGAAAKQTVEQQYTLHATHNALAHAFTSVVGR
ncbi:glycosyltransferase family 4 protein [Salinimonas marina]|uniref:Glycosyltransferase family 4 protein n=1 Tax=Salinimonas marina TaxID=2785918 RepID=A0A7S9HDP8_9ALTE|nr:glycosyltransferase family 4 protein [Salinimonas marina]QPG06394.1 glycosyltransferase family 4 protein [Salinimonas marina]